MDQSEAGNLLSIWKAWADAGWWHGKAIMRCAVQKWQVAFGFLLVLTALLLLLV